MGLSLSDAEASIAAPFTASTQNISPLLSLMREGRAALVTSISCFKYMALYSIIQFVTVIRLYQLNANMSDTQYLWIDLFVIFPLAGTSHARTHARTHAPIHKSERHEVPLDQFFVSLLVAGTRHACTHIQTPLKDAQYTYEPLALSLKRSLCHFVRLPVVVLSCTHAHART